MRSLVIWGCGGHGRVVLDIARAMHVFEIIEFFTDSPPPAQRVDGIPVLSGDIRQAVSLQTSEIVVAIGSNRTREARFNEAVSARFRIATCIHPSAVISPSAHIGPGTVVMPGAVVQAGARVGRNCIVNTAAVVEHDCTVHDHAHLSPGVILGGGATVGCYAHMGIGSVALPGSTIGDAAVVGAGAVVLRAVVAGATVAGVPARPLDRACPR